MITKFKKYLRKFKLWRLLLYKTKPEYRIYKKFNFLTKNSIFIDFGANVGNVSQIINDLYGCSIHCYEPHPGAFKILNKKFKFFDNIFLYNLAVSDENTFGNLFLHKETDLSKIEETNLSEASSLDKNKTNIDFQKKISVKTTNVESIIDDFDFIDCIKIDIEGYEYKILPYIFKYKNKIGKVFCEFHGNTKVKNANFHLNKDYVNTLNYIKKNNLENWILEWI